MKRKMPIRKRYNRTRKDGHRTFTWYFDKSYPPPIGRIRERIPTARTQAHADLAARNIMDRIHNGIYPPANGGSVRFSEFVVDSYLPWACDAKLSWKSDTYRSKALLSAFGDHRMWDIERNPSLIENYKIERKKTPRDTRNGQMPRSAAVVNRELALLSSIFRLAKQRNLVCENPVRKVKPLLGEHPRDRYLLYDEEERLLRTLVGPRAHLHDLVVLDINTGLRKNELFSLEADHVDLHRDVLKLSERQGFTIKSRRARLVPLNCVSRDILRRLVEESSRTGRRYLFTNPRTGTKYTTIRHAWLTACRLAGIKNLRFHDLRRTFGTRAADRGAAIAAIKKVMGHSSIKTTESYVSATDESIRRVVEALVD